MICEAAPDTIRRGHAVHPLAAVQSEYSLLYRQPAEETLPTCRELGIAYVAYSPLGRGFLSGRIQSAAEIPEDDRKRQHPRFQGANFEHNRRLVARLEGIARDKRCTPSQLVLAWLLHRGEDIVPIPGTKRRRYLAENLAAADIVLQNSDLQLLAETFPPGVASGTRYSEIGMKMLDR